MIELLRAPIRVLRVARLNAQLKKDDTDSDQRADAGGDPTISSDWSSTYPLLSELR